MSRPFRSCDYPSLTMPEAHHAHSVDHSRRRRGARVVGVNVQEGLLSVLFLLASLSALIAAWGLYQETQR
jgi:hypothetical protein